MDINKSIFKAYDIRGIYPTDLNEELAYKIGIAFADYMKPETVIMGRDGRTHGESLFNQAKQGLLDMGINVINLGLVSSDMYYHACAEKGLPGMMVTASHNPKEYNVNCSILKTSTYRIGANFFMNWSLINILMLFGIFQGAVLIAFILNNKENNSKAKWYLLLVVFGLIMNLLFYMLRDIGWNEKYPIFESLYAPWALLSSGSFYLYAVYTSPFEQKEKYFKWALVPFIAVTIFYVFFPLCLHGVIPISISAETTHYVYMIEEYLNIAYCIFMGLLSYQKLNQIERKSVPNFLIIMSLN